MDYLQTRYDDVLDDSEHDFFLRFRGLRLPSRALLVRLLLRRGPFFLEGKLAYDEIPDMAEAGVELLEAGLLCAEQTLTLNDLFELHTKPELLKIFSRHLLSPALRKEQMLEILRERHSLEQTYCAWNPQSQQGAWRVMVGELCERLRLMFFGNLRQGWSAFVLADLGIFRYEPVAIDGAARGFGCREDVDCYLAIHQCRQALEEGAAPGDLLQEAARCCSANPWLERRRAKLLLRIGQACERAHDWQLAEQAYAQCGYAGARHRHMRVYERTGRFAEALALAQVAHASPESDEEAQRVQRMLPRLQRKLGQKMERLSAATPEHRWCRQDLVLPKPAEVRPVEYLVRDGFNSEIAPAFYVENALMSSLFGLLFWPAIFAPVPGAFFHPFQSGPADLDAPDFVERRRTEFDACLALLDQGSYQDVVRARFLEKYGVQSPFVFWGVMTQELLDLALTCIPATQLRLIFLRILRDLKANRNGFPDLVRFWPQEARFEMVEVKGPGDKLQDNQIRWLHYFAEHGIPASVCTVRWRESSDAQPAAVPDALLVDA